MKMLRSQVAQSLDVSYSDAACKRKNRRVMRCRAQLCATRYPLLKSKRESTLLLTNLSSSDGVAFFLRPPLRDEFAFLWLAVIP